MEIESGLKTRESSRSILIVAVLVSLFDFYFLRYLMMAMIFAWDFNPLTILLMLHLFLFSYSVFRLNYQYATIGHKAIVYVGIIAICILIGFWIATVYIVVFNNDDHEFIIDATLFIAVPIGLQGFAIIDFIKNFDEKDSQIIIQK